MAHTPTPWKITTYPIRKSLSTIGDELYRLSTLYYRGIDGRLDKRCVMCDALLGGLSSGKVNVILEMRLSFSCNLKEEIDILSNAWDGKEHLSGALYFANRYYLDSETN